MTLRRAIQTLIAAAERDCVGAGCGIRGLPSDSAINDIKEAARRVWPIAFGISLTDEEASRRFGFSVKEAKEGK